VKTRKITIFIGNLKQSIWKIQKPHIFQLINKTICSKLSTNIPISFFCYVIPININWKIISIRWTSRCISKSTCYFLKFYSTNKVSTYRRRLHATNRSRIIGILKIFGRCWSESQTTPPLFHHHHLYHPTTALAPPSDKKLVIFQYILVHKFVENYDSINYSVNWWKIKFSTEIDICPGKIWQSISKPKTRETWLL